MSETECSTTKPSSQCTGRGTGDSSPSITGLARLIAAMLGTLRDNGPMTPESVREILPPEIRPASVDEVLSLLCALEETGEAYCQTFNGTRYWGVHA